MGALRLAMCCSKYCIRLYLVVCFVCVRDVRKRVWWLPMVMMVESWSDSISMFNFNFTDSESGEEML